jgi:ParB family chromosome partitioning protein
MAKSKGGLGRGLAALIPTGPATSTINDVVIGGGQSRQDVAHRPSPGPDATAHHAADTRTADVDGSGPHYQEIPIDQIRPNPKNPRTVFDEDALAELTHSIKEFGLLQPVVVRPVDDGYELVMGERRWRAAQRAGVPTIAAIVRRTEDADLLRDALLENIHRSNLNPLEVAAAYQELLD